jgi:hypothetical protein
MALDVETVACGNFALEIFDVIVPEFRNCAAVVADHVVVMLPFCHTLVAGHAVAELDLAGNSRFDEQFQGATNCGVADFRVFGPDLPAQFIDAHMPVGRKKGLEYNLPLPG